jgi:trans-AT polyketide synthase/acyltransferase/oxidoreductase domain-containing protein
MNRTSNIFLFPGQGAQQRGMGQELFKSFPELTAEADQVLGYSIEDLCVHDSQRRLHQTRYTQPALYVVNILHYLDALRKGLSAPGFLAGHSLGEFCALYVAGAFDFATGLRLVMQRGDLMSRASGGGMAAVLNLPVDTVLRVLRSSDGQVEAANFNTPRQTVLSGPAAGLAQVQPALEAEGGMVVPLNVSAPFHSRYMREAAQEFASFLESSELYDPVLPVMSNVHARPYQPGEIKNNLVEQMFRPVRWTETIAYLLAWGGDRFMELGPKPVLGRLVDEIRQDAVGLPR